MRAESFAAEAASDPKGSSAADAGKKVGKNDFQSPRVMTGVIDGAAAGAYLLIMNTFKAITETEKHSDIARAFTLIDFEPLSLAYEDPESEQTRRTVYQHFHDLAALDTEGLMRPYAADCRLTIGTATCEGTAAIKNYYARIIQELSDQHTTQRLFHLDIRGKLAFLTWEQQSESKWIAFGASTFIVLGGKIVWQQLVTRERIVKEGGQGAGAST